MFFFQTGIENNNKEHFFNRGNITRAGTATFILFYFLLFFYLLTFTCYLFYFSKGNEIKLSCYYSISTCTCIWNQETRNRYFYSWSVPRMCFIIFDSDINHFYTHTCAQSSENNLFLPLRRRIVNMCQLISLV